MNLHDIEQKVIDTATQAAHAAVDTHVDAAVAPAGLPDDVKEALRPYVKPLCDAIMGPLKAGVDAALKHIPFVGGMVAGVVNPILDGLEPKMIAALEVFLT